MIFALVLLVGLLIPFQNAMGGRLGKTLGSPYQSALVTCVTSFTSLFVLLLLSGHRIFPSSEQLQHFTLLSWTPGLYFALATSILILAMPKIGSIHSLILSLLGQLSFSILTESFGWLGTPQKSPTPMTFIGALLIVGAIYMIVRSKSSSEETASRLNRYHLLAYTAGIFRALQFITTGKIGQILQSSPQAALLTFLEASIILLLILLIRTKSLRFLRESFRFSIPIWFYIGSLLPAFILPVNALSSTVIGPNLTVTVGLFGQFLSGTIIDHFGFFQVPINEIRFQKIAGLLVIGLGIILMKFFA